MSKRLLLFALLCAAPLPASAYPPAPYHRIYGTVRDEQGNPLGTKTGTLILSGVENQEIVRSTSDTSIGPGINYSLKIPMDSGTTPVLYSVSALRPLLPFTIRVVINNVSHVPVEMTGATWTTGDPAATTRLDLTLGVDSDGDCLPDAWELLLIDSDLTGRFTSLADVNPGDDLDFDGRTNLQEYIDGTYALETSDRLSLEILELKDGLARLQFLAIAGRTYSISSSGDLETFAPQAFSLRSDGGGSALFYRADDVRVVDIYVPAEAEPKRRFFKLKVQ